MDENPPNTPDERPMPAPVPDLQAWYEKDREHTRRENETMPENKSILFDALAATGITHVSVHFDGYGDSGQIEDIDPHARRTK